MDNTTNNVTPDVYPFSADITVNDSQNFTNTQAANA
jgi:hypothetical protein